MRPEFEVIRDQFYFRWGMILLAVFIVCGLILARTHAQNNAQPVLTVPVRLIKKKKEYHSGTGGRHHASLSLFFLTENEEFLDFNVNSFDWEMYNEGDLGNLTYQGFRFIKFERTHINPPT